MRLIPLLLILGIASALSSSGNRLLVVLEEAADQQKYSQFFADLNGRGYALSFESPKNDKLALIKYGERVYDHLILFPPKSKGFGPSFTPKLLLDFINNDGNIFLTLSSESTPTAVSSLLLELDIYLPPDRASVTIDHFNYDTLSSPDKHDVLLIPQPEAIRPDVKNFFGGNGVIAFPRSVAQSLGNANPLLVPILRAKRTAYSYSPKEEPNTVEDPFEIGEQISLVSALQARNSARFTVFGSAEALEDKWFTASVKGEGKKTETANREFARQVSKWTFKETGVLKVGKVEHHLADEKSNVSQGNPKIYRVKNDVTFTIELSEYTETHFSPPKIPLDDIVQLEFSMLSPFHRLSLTPTSSNSNSTIYSASFTCPDQHGIFAFKVDYRRPFMTIVEVKEEVTVRHFAHDEWPRSWSISGAWTWIAGIWVTISAWLAFVAIWLWSGP